MGMRVIGLTGGIGSGKSTVARFLEEMGAAVIDADKVGHEVLKPGGEVWERVVKEFGGGIVAAGGDIDRARLGRLVFGSQQALERLNGIMYPAMDSIIKAQLEEYRRQGVRVVVLEAAVLLEAGKTLQVDEVWVVVASEASVLKRLAGHPGLSHRAARARMRAQLSNEERIKQADVVIYNDGSLGELKARIIELGQKLQMQN
jgi:dephospho-CoA kinase